MVTVRKHEIMSVRKHDIIQQTEKENKWIEMIQKEKYQIIKKFDHKPSGKNSQKSCDSFFSK